MIDRHNSILISEDYECLSYKLCKRSWELSNPEKWKKYNTREDGAFSKPLALFVGKDYLRHGGLMLVGINFHYSGDGWDARQGPGDPDHTGRLSWRKATRGASMFKNAGKLIRCIFGTPDLLAEEVDRFYAFANIVKCSPSNKISPSSRPNRVQYHQCVVEQRHIIKEIEWLNPGLILCSGYDAYEQMLALYIEKRIQFDGDDSRYVARLDKDTWAVGIPHLSGGMLSLNSQNKRYRERKGQPAHTPSLRGKSYSEAKAYLKSVHAVLFDTNIILTAMAYDMGRTLKEMTPTLYQHIQDQLAER